MGHGAARAGRDAAAFAEGRRLRDAARARARRRHVRGTRREMLRARRRRARTRPVLLAAGAVAALALIGDDMAGVMAVMALFMMFLMALPFVLGAVAFSASRRHRHPAALHPVVQWPAPPRRVPRPPADAAWRGAHTRFQALRADYAAYECDAMAVLRLPALADVTVPSTARFVDAFAEAQACETGRFPGEPHAGRFVGAVERAENAWQAARDAAERIRLSSLSAEERSTVERVIKLLTTARESDSDAERLAAYSRARTELAKLDKLGHVTLPRAARAALDAAARGELPGGS